MDTTQKVYILTLHYDSAIGTLDEVKVFSSKASAESYAKSEKEKDKSTLFNYDIVEEMVND